MSPAQSGADPVGIFVPQEDLAALVVGQLARMGVDPGAEGNASEDDGQRYVVSPFHNPSIFPVFAAASS